MRSSFFKLKGTFCTAVAAGLSLAAQAQTTNVISPGNSIVGVAATPGSSASAIATVGTAAGVNNHPAGEPPGASIDRNTATKYLNFAEVNAGIILTLSGNANVSGIRFTTANDSPPRDPITVSVEGTTAPDATTAAGGATWTSLYSGDAGLATDPGRFTQGALVPIANALRFNTYRILVTTVRDGVAANSVQFSEVDLLGGYYTPGPATITQQPQSATNRVGQTATLTVTADGTTPYSFQWYSNGVAVAGATGPSHTTPTLALANNNNSYTVTVSNSLGGSISSPAVLTVVDNPAVSAAGSRNDPTGVYVTFNEPMDSATTLNVANYVLTNSSGPVAISSATFFGPGSSTVRLAVPTLTVGSTYSLTVSNAADLSLDPLVPNPTTVSFVHGAGIVQAGLTLKRYENIGGVNVSDLTSNAKFPCLPDYTDPNVASMEYSSFIPGHNDPVTRADPGLENYGAWIYGQFVAPLTGNYTFGLSSDDGSALYLSTDSDPSHKTQLIAQPGWNGDREFVGRISAPIALTAGQQYYMEVFMKEGGGGDHVTVAIQKPGDPAIVNGQGGIDRSLFATNLTADCGRVQFSTLGPVTVAVNPVSQSIVEGNSVSFYVQADGSPSYAFQWYSNGVAIAGATGSTHTFAPRFAANGSTYYAIVNNGFSSATSTVATLTVALNPQVTSVTVRNDITTNVYVTFSQPVGLDGTYTIDNGVTVNSIAYGATHNEVVLSTTPVNPDTTYTLTIAGERGETDDLPTAPDPTIRTFRFGYGGYCTDFAALPAGATVTGSAAVTGGILHLTDAVNSLQGNFFMPDQAGGFPVDRLQISFKTQLGGGTCCGARYADGMSFNYASDFGSATGYGEEGIGTGLTVTFDTWDNATTDTAPSIEIRYKGVTVATQAMAGIREGGRAPAGPFKFDAGGNPLSLDTSNQFVNVTIDVSPSGQLDMSYNDVAIFENVQLPNYTPFVGANIGFGARTGGANANHWIDDLCFNAFTVGPVFFTQEPTNTTALELQSATFRAAVDGTPPYFFQWYTNGTAVPGANSAIYNTGPVTGDMDGILVSVVASNEFSSVTSSNATLDVLTNPRVVSVVSRRENEVHVTYTRAVELASGTYDFDNGGFEQGRAYGADHRVVVVTTDAPLFANTTYTVTITDVTEEGNAANVLFPNPTVATFRHGYGSLCADFAAMPPGASVIGSARVADGFLHITDTANDQHGTFFLPDQNGGQPMDRLVVSFKALVGSPNPGTRIADGFSFNVANISAGTPVNLDGAGTGLTVSFDTWDNNAPDTAPAIEVRYKGITIATQAMAGIREGGRAPNGPFLFDANGNPLSIDTSNQWVNVLIMVSPTGTFDMYYKNQVIFQNLQLPNYTPFVGANFVFGGDTGGANENAWIDDLCINAFSLGDVVITRQPANATVNENPPGRASFSVDVDGLPPYSAQWYSNGVPIPGATALAYTTPPLNRTADGAGYFVIVSNMFNSVTSQVATVTIVRDTNAPTVLYAAYNCTSNVYVLFSERLNAATANNPGNYTINHGVTVTGASLEANGRTVVLTVSPPIDPNDASVLTVNGVADNGPFPNTITNARIAIAAKGPVIGPTSGTDSNNLIVVQAEDYDVNRSFGPQTPTVSWVTASSLPGYSGSGYVDAIPNASGFGGGDTPNLFTNASRLDYCINFPAAGTYYMWARGSTANDGGNNSFHFGIDGVSPDEFSRRVGNRTNNWGADPANVNAFGWVRDANGVAPDMIARIVVPTPGMHTLNVWVREDGIRLDAFVLTTNAAFTFDATSAVPTSTSRTATRSLRIVKNADGSATISWDGDGWTLQATDELKANPAQTVWQNQPFTSPLVIPPGYFGTGNSNVFFRLCSP